MAFFTKLREKIFDTKERPAGLFNLKETKRIPELPKKLSNIPVTYEIIGDLVAANIQISLYRVGEPILNNDEKNLLEMIKRGLYEVINLEVTDNIEEYIEKSTRVIISELDIRISKQSLKNILYYIYKDLIGFGKIESILLDDLVSHIYFNKEKITIKHRIYGNLDTNIDLNAQELFTILQKLARKCNQELDTRKRDINCNVDNWNILVQHNPDQIMKSLFSIQKIFPQYKSPLELIKERKVSPEVIAFLWMAMQEKKNLFFIRDANLLYAMNYFLPIHAKVLTNIKGYIPNEFTETYLGERYGEEDFAIIENYNGQGVHGTILTTIDHVEAYGNIVCFIEKGVVKSVRENGNEIFGHYDNKFFYDLSNSDFIKSKGNSAILEQELQYRTKLLMVLIQNNTTNKDFKTLIQQYTENPTAILKRAGLL
jgi:hypothetical protein